MTDIEEIGNGNFELRCPSMELVPVVEGLRESYQGAGLISFIAGELKIDFFSNQNYHHGKIFLESPAKAGELFEDSDHYVLRANDINGRQWLSTPMLPDFTFGSGVVATGKLAEIRAVEACNLSISRPEMKLRFLGDLDLPYNQSAHSSTKLGDATLSQSWNLDSASWESAGYEFFIRASGNWTTIEISREGSLADGICLRVEESLEFLLAWPVRATVIEEYAPNEMRTRLRSYRPQPITSNALSPIRRGSAEYRKYGGKLFECFFRHVESYSSPGRPPISRILQYIVQMSTSPIDARALSLGVAVEGLLTDLYKDVTRPSDDFLLDLKKALLLIQDSQLHPQTISRIQGSLGSMRTSRAKDRLLALKDGNVIQAAQYEAWNKLRNSSAHAEVHHLDNNFLSLYYKVLTLAYCLVFEAVNYAGPFTDYGVRGWPTEWYPFGSSEKSAGVET
jgi:hypothetical protein